MRALVWLRGKDLRLSDHQAVSAGLEADELVFLFVLDDFFFAHENQRRFGPRLAYLSSALAALKNQIEALGSQLFVVSGRSQDQLPRLARIWSIDCVHAQAWSAPLGRLRDERLARALACPLVLHEGETLLPPGTVLNKEGKPYKVFTPFYRAMRPFLDGVEALAAPRTLPPPPGDLAPIQTVTIPDLQHLLPAGMSGVAAGEAPALAQLGQWRDAGLGAYASTRDRMDRPGTSQLSAPLKFGTLSPRTIWTECRGADGSEPFLRQLAWREFSHMILWHFPQTLQVPFRADFHRFPWREAPAHWQAWVEGLTGYPVVDAAARQLLAEGYVHNRARMVAASFLSKHLLIDYRRGEAHYMRHLIDGDWAQNNLGWQWSAGCGTDAAPYFRVFNPSLQGKRYDPEGNYVRRWVPELSSLPAAWIHEPWRAPAEVLKKAGVQLGRHYPLPIVDHRQARADYLLIARDALKGPASD